MTQANDILEQNKSLQTRVSELEATNNITLRLGRTLELPLLLDEMVRLVLELTHMRQALVLVVDEDNANINFGAMTPAPSDSTVFRTVKQLSIRVYSAGHDPLVSAWMRNEATIVDADGDPLALPGPRLAALLDAETMLSLPLMVQERLIGVLLLDQSEVAPDERSADRRLLEAVAPNLAIVLENARQHSKTVEELAAKMHELYILRQIDRELNDMITPSHVFDLTLDWALRFTLGQSASLALYNEETDELRIVAAYGYDVPPETLSQIRIQQGGGIAHRVALSGRAEVIPDVSMDKDYIRVATVVRSQLCVPVMREDRVIAIITIESSRLNAFTEDHLDFVEKLAARAGVAIDNARLYSEAVREREKLSRILSNTADVVIVVNPDNRIMLINESAVAAMHLYPDRQYVGQTFQEVFEDTDLQKIYRRATATAQTIVGEVTLPDDRIFHANLTHSDGIGWIIVMHDITPLKETDRLKNELVATVSHDLKQPLSVMNGYSELLLMQQKFDMQSINYVKMIQRSINNMRQLIDDLLNLARIESGMQLEMTALDLSALIDSCIEGIKPVADAKLMNIQADLPDAMPPIMGEKSSLEQVFANLVSNAVKYTPPEGQIRIKIEQNEMNLRVAVQDNGLGISPEDQSHIFDRFYRVRRPETDSIEGTGLGLAIVKRLVEAHNGQIGLESRLGEGSTFYVTLPIYQT